MHSTAYLLQEVEDKYQHVQSTIQYCKHEQQLLQGNIQQVRSSITQSLSRHMETLQCRTKWLNCHAESIFHLKDDALSKQITDLQNASNELNNCLSNANCEDADGFRHLLKNTLKQVDDAPLLITENGSMIFNAENDKLESTIISFGKISMQPNLDEAPCVEEFATLSDDDDIFILKKQKSIEMEIKSIEMIHMTSESANTENQKDNIELINFDHVESTNNPWLIKKSNMIEQKYDKYNFVKEDMDDKWLAHKIINNGILVNQMVMEEKVSPWILACSTKKYVSAESINPRITFDHLNLPSDQYLIKKDVSNESFAPTSRVPPCQNPLMKNNEAQDSASDEKMSIKMENEIWTSQSSNVDHLDSMIVSVNSSYLYHGVTKNDHQIDKEPNKAIKHMDFILNQPSKAYLHSPPTSSLSDPSLCNWLIGTSSNRCNDCDESCSFDDSTNNNWLKIATNW